MTHAHGTTERTQTQEAALALAAAGHLLFPLRGKRPYEEAGKPDVDGNIIPEGKGGFHTATTDIAKIARWMAAYPDCNWGTPTGHHIDAMTGQPNAYPFYVIDVDPDHDGIESLQELISQYGVLPDTVTQRTGSGGFHYCFSSPEDLRNSASAIAPGIDVRGTGGYIVLSPSIHPDTGLPYEWLLGQGLLDGQMAELPEPWRVALKSSRRQRAEPGARILKGTQEATLMRIAGAMRRQGATESEILAALRVVSEERCDPAVKEADLKRMAASAARYGPADTGYPRSELITGPNVAEMSDQAWQLTSEHNMPVRLFDFGGQPHRMTTAEGVPQLTRIDQDVMMLEVSRVIDTKQRRSQIVGGEVEHRDTSVIPPKALIAGMLATAHKPLPELEGIVRAPIAAPDGEIISQSGYSEKTGTFYAPAHLFEVPPIPAVPGPQDIATAKQLILEELLGEFPFVGEADRAHAVALARIIHECQRGTDLVWGGC